MLDNVFPIDLAQNQNLDKLSVVASRLLNTPDIYDINNLSRPGVCGDYAVFLQKELTKKLLPYTIELPDAKGVKTRETVVYQSVRAAADESVRKAVCSDMVGSMLRVVAIVLAALSSMQVASPSRPRTLRSQKGGAGAPPEVTQPYKWLVANGFIAPTPVPLDPTGTLFTGQRVPINRSAPLPGNANAKFTLVFEGLRGGVVNALFLAEGDNMPKDGVRVMFLAPISVPVSAGYPAASILPMRILTRSGATFAAGALLRSTVNGEPLFRSFYADTTSRPLYLEQLLYVLFLHQQGVDIQLPEPRAAADAAGLEFSNLKFAPSNTAPILNKLQATLQEHIRGFTGGIATPPVALPGYGVGTYPAAAAGFPGYPGAPVAVPPAYGALARPVPAPGGYSLFGPAGALAYRGVPGAAIPGAGYYHIPLIATNNIMTIFKKYSKVIPTESSPAVVRAYALRGTSDPATRKFQPRVCDDDYWRKTDLSDITPWATFQFLSTSDWESLKDQASAKLEPEWDGFLSDLESIYTGENCPKLARVTPGAKLLPLLKFTDIANTKLCKAKETPYVEFRKIQDGILRLQGLYAENTKRMWAILNSLIQIIKDPESKVEMIRLNDAVLKGPSSRAYVEQKARETREALRSYYAAVEREYVGIIKAIGNDLP